MISAWLIAISIIVIEGSMAYVIYKRRRAAGITLADEIDELVNTYKSLK